MTKFRGDAFVERWACRNSTALLHHKQANMHPGSYRDREVDRDKTGRGIGELGFG